MWQLRTVMFLVALYNGHSQPLKLNCSLIPKRCECDGVKATVRCYGGTSYNNDTSFLQHLPPEVFGLTATGFQFHDVPQIGQCQPPMQLKMLDLSSNNITNMTAVSVQCLSDLETLSLLNNNLHLSKHNDMFNGTTLSKLRVLNLESAFYNGINCSDVMSNNCTDNIAKLSWYVDSISHLTSLEILNLASNGIWTVPVDIQKQIGRLPLLRHLNLSANQLTFPHLDFQPTNGIQVLDISDNRIAFLTDSLLKDLDNFKDLKELHVQNNLFVCDCNAMRFITWLQNKTKTAFVQHRDSLSCFEGNDKVKRGTKLMNVRVADLSCEHYVTPVTTPTNIIIAVLIGLALLAVCVILFLNRSLIKKQFKRLCRKSDHDLQSCQYVSVET